MTHIELEPAPLLLCGLGGVAQVQLIEAVLLELITHQEQLEGRGLWMGDKEDRGSRVSSRRQQHIRIYTYVYTGAQHTQERNTK